MCADVREYLTRRDNRPRLRTYAHPKDGRYGLLATPRHRAPVTLSVLQAPLRALVAPAFSPGALSPVCTRPGALCALLRAPVTPVEVTP